MYKAKQCNEKYGNETVLLNSLNFLTPNCDCFVGLNVLLPYCNFVDMFEYVPSTRVTRRCHYYDPENNAACTFGVWHPLAAEKLLTYYVNFANDYNVFQKVSSVSQVSKI